MQSKFPSLEDLKAGNDAAWEIAFSYLWPVASYAARRGAGLLTDQDVEEVACDAIREAVNLIQQVHNEEHLRALVSVIAHRLAISLARRKSAGKRAPWAALIEYADQREAEILHEQIDARDPRSDAEASELVALLNQALSALDDLTRELLLEKFILAHTYEELTKKHRLPMGTVCAKVARGLRKVRHILRQDQQLMKELEAFLR